MNSGCCCVKERRGAASFLLLGERVSDIRAHRAVEQGLLVPIIRVIAGGTSRERLQGKGDRICQEGDGSS